MRITISHLKRLITEALLSESACPLCGSQGAYVGLSDVECPNPSCSAFSQRQADEASPQAATAAPTKKKQGKPAAGQNKIVMEVTIGTNGPIYTVPLPNGTTKTYDVWPMVEDMLRTEGYDNDQIDDLFDQHASHQGRAWELDEQITREIIHFNNVTHVIDPEATGDFKPTPVDQWLVDPSAI